MYIDYRLEINPQAKGPYYLLLKQLSTIKLTSNYKTEGYEETAAYMEALLKAANIHLSGHDSQQYWYTLTTINVNDHLITCFMSACTRH